MISHKEKKGLIGSIKHEELVELQEALNCMFGWNGIAAEDALEHIDYDEIIPALVRAHAYNIAIGRINAMIEVDDMQNTNPA